MKTKKLNLATISHFTLTILAFSASCNLSLYAQDIMSYEEYQSLTHEEPYIVNYEPDTGELLYFGSRHSFDPQDSQFEILTDQLTDYAPEVIYTEGFPENISSLTMVEAIQRYGEFGVTWKLAEEATIPVHSLEPDRQLEVDHLRDQGWTDNHIILYFTLRQVSQSNEQGVDLDFDILAPQYFESLNQRFGLQGPVTIEDLEETVRELLPDVDDWKQIPRYYFYPGPQDPERYTNRLSTDSNQFRDRYHTNLIVEAVNEGKRVFVIAGSAHAVMQEPALRAILEDGR